MIVIHCCEPKHVQPLCAAKCSEYLIVRFVVTKRCETNIKYWNCPSAIFYLRISHTLVLHHHGICMLCHCVKHNGAACNLIEMKALKLCYSPSIVIRFRGNFRELFQFSLQTPIARNQRFFLSKAKQCSIYVLDVIHNEKRKLYQVNDARDWNKSGPNRSSCLVGFN